MVREATVYYVPLSVMQELARARDAYHYPERCAEGVYDSGIGFGLGFVVYQSSCNNESTARLRRLDAAIRRSIKFAKAHLVPVPATRDHCRGLDDVPTHITSWNAHDRVELIYADWAAR